MKRAVILIPFLLVTLAALGRAAQTVAVLSDIKGQVSKGPSLAGLFEPFEDGQTLMAKSGSHWTLSFVKAGRRISGGEGRYLVSGDGVTPAAGGAGTQQTVAPQITGMVLNRSINWDRMGGVARKMDTDLGWTFEAVSESPDVELTWEASDKFSEVEIVVEKVSDHSRTVRRVPAHPSQLSVQLEAGRSYRLGLQGLAPKAGPEPAISQTLRVLSGPEVESLRSLEQGGTPVELCYQYLQLGLREKARKLAAQLLPQYPDQEKLRLLVAPPAGS